MENLVCHNIEYIANVDRLWQQGQEGTAPPEKFRHRSEFTPKPTLFTPLKIYIMRINISFKIGRKESE